MRYANECSAVQDMLSMQNDPVFYLVMLTFLAESLNNAKVSRVVQETLKYRDSFTIVIVFSENIVIVIFSLLPSSSYM